MLRTTGSGLASPRFLYYYIRTHNKQRARRPIWRSASYVCLPRVVRNVSRGKMAGGGVSRCFYKIGRIQWMMMVMMVIVLMMASWMCFSLHRCVAQCDTMEMGAEKYITYKKQVGKWFARHGESFLLVVSVLGTMVRWDLGVVDGGDCCRGGDHGGASVWNERRQNVGYSRR